ncbi:lipopolysaccharide kinase InaA family protein [Pseudomonas sp. CCI3.2]|uniref:lipopolysaccharide kinase InaA family protein n=1 Tax=unclassified Pseudomonas TaxID=196821 RepID=UPI002AC97301|nr:MULTISPECIES: lipopolysaccharide kinase InaA family protein [unclassified Pseudomonas]MEB0079231.1 lipopolysaccharide kinase InaA family protein [Pseudomonas sp. MH10out]MEB0090535.1 lipopolysaccharide kinase InaA family protein [Pseudomonas sp. CCI4.2]MEB0103228.1 lipopolysaccharide kinase InaA family protein [Pseudomonas sp. CCI3.2]MEB0119991.1 lipopolysaccharide kinase InaA family protein [Pseudomonas sp. CCI1.2]MEB0130710.1 lipopolysaccharide kinase InaA family protein [Pseudomonas sp. 
MSDFIAATERGLLERHGLADFNSLWDVQLDAVDEPNIGRGGWSSVFRLELEGAGFYLKRQNNYLTRTLHRPFGEPSFSREFRNITRYQSLGIPSLQAVFFGERLIEDERRAILMTRALDSWTDLDSLLQQWPTLSAHQRLAILQACGQLARTLHAANQVHGCFYPKHIFLRSRANAYLAQLIDLEKTRPAFFGWRDRIKDLEPLLRRAPFWTEVEVRELLATYLQAATDSELVGLWWQRLAKRSSYKEAL